MIRQHLQISEFGLDTIEDREKRGKKGDDGFDLFPKRSLKRTIYLRKANPAATPPWSLLQNSSEIDVDNTRYHSGRSDNDINHDDC